MTRLATLAGQLVALLGPRRRVAAALGGGLVALGSLCPWATFAFGYPGKMTLAGFPGGARVFTLLLAPAALLVLVNVAGRRRAALAGSLGVLAVGGGNLAVIAKDGGGLGAVAFGAWLTVVGGALTAVAAASLPATAPPAGHDVGEPPQPGARRRLPAPLELLAVASSLGTALYLVVYGLDVGESTRFVSFLAFVGFGAAILQRLGVFAWLQELFERHRTVTLALTVLAASAFPFTQGGSNYWLRVFASIGVFATAAIGLNVVVGLAGLLDLGYIAFFGVGAYIGALLADAAATTVHVHVPFLLVVLIGACVSALFGVAIGAPTLRLRGDYLAIVTLGFGEIFRIVANNWDGLTRGPNDISGVPNLALGSYDFGESHEVLGVDLGYFANYYFAELVLVALAIMAFTRLNDSRIGRAWVAIREDETAAAAMGVNTIRLKLLAFAIGAFLAGAAGTVNSHVTTSVTPDSYTFLESILLLAAVVLGGMGTVPGALLGSAALFILPEKLRSFQDIRLLMFGVALILMMRFRPEGIVASRRRQRELHEEGGAGATGAPPGAPVAAA